MLMLSLSILVLLVFANVLVNLRIRVHATPELINNRKRIHTWWVISLICMMVFYIGDWALTILLVCLIYWAAFEFTQIQKTRLTWLRLLVLTIFIVVYELAMKYYIDMPFLFFIVPGFILISYYIVSGRPGLRSVLLLVFCVTSIESILLISHQSIRSGYDSGLILLFLFFITSLNDIFQYLCGNVFGKKSLAPTLSPGKTIEGAVGGIILTGFIVAVTLPFIVHITWSIAIVIGVFISLLGIIGDLSFSYVKRQANIKDSGMSMPGHGGLLDRIDSLTLTAPGFGLCLSVIN